MSSSSSRTSKRVRQAIVGSDVSETSSTHASMDSDSQANAEAAAENSEPNGRRRAGSRSTLALQRHRSHSMDNRPVDPSPIQVSHTVAMGGQRPIGLSDHHRGPDFSGAQTILNRPIAPNTTAQDDEMLGYLD